MKTDAAIIQSFPDELLKSYWVNWCESFLTNGLEISESELPAFNIKSIQGMGQNADPPSRAIELYRLGVLLNPINVNGSKTLAWMKLANSQNIISTFGYVAYLIAKTYLTPEHANNRKLEKAYSAISAICTIKQYFKFKEGDSEFVISANTIYQHLLASFSRYAQDKLARQYIASGMICSLKNETYNEQFIRDVLSNKNVKEFVITNNTSHGGNIRERINLDNIDIYLEKLRSREISFDNTTNQRFCNFFVGNFFDSPERGYVNNGLKYFENFMHECSVIEIENFSENPFIRLYSNENYELSNLQTPDVFETLKHIFSKYSKNTSNLENLMKTLEEGCTEAIKILGWSSSIKLPTNTKNIIYYGAPGTGKSYKVEQVLSGVPDDRKERVTFHPEYDNASFVGGYKPVSEFDNVKNEFVVKYKFVPQVFTSIYIKAWLDSDHDYYLAIEEINRGNCAEIFGELFQLLDRNSNYSITPSREMIEYLRLNLGSEHEGIKAGKIKLPPNLILLATMNTSDQSLFPMDSAFKRRWSWEYIPINYEETNEDGSLNESVGYLIKIDEGTNLKWIDFIKNINERIKSNPNLGMDKCIGNYFVKANENVIELDELINKVIFYLWNDVFKDEENDVFQNGISYEDFFPVPSNGQKRVKDLLTNIGII